MRQVCSEASNESFAGKPVCFLHYEGGRGKEKHAEANDCKKKERVKKNRMKRGILKGI